MFHSKIKTIEKNCSDFESNFRNESNLANHYQSSISLHSQNYSTNQDFNVGVGVGDDDDDDDGLNNRCKKAKIRKFPSQLILNESKSFLLRTFKPSLRNLRRYLSNGSLNQIQPKQSSSKESPPPPPPPPPPSSSSSSFLNKQIETTTTSAMMNELENNDCYTNESMRSSTIIYVRQSTNDATNHNSIKHPPPFQKPKRTTSVQNLMQTNPSNSNNKAKSGREIANKIDLKPENRINLNAVSVPNLLSLVTIDQCMDQIESSIDDPKRDDHIGSSDLQESTIETPPQFPSSISNQSSLSLQSSQQSSNIESSDSDFNTNSSQSISIQVNSSTSNLDRNQTNGLFRKNDPPPIASKRFINNHNHNHHQHQHQLQQQQKNFSANPQNHSNLETKNLQKINQSRTLPLGLNYGAAVLRIADVDCNLALECPTTTSPLVNAEDLFQSATIINGHLEYPRFSTQNLRFQTLPIGNFQLDDHRYLTYGTSAQLQQEFGKFLPWPTLTEFRLRRKLRRFKRTARKLFLNGNNFVGKSFNRIQNVRKLIKMTKLVENDTELLREMLSRGQLNDYKDRDQNAQLSLSRSSSLTSLLNLIEEVNKNLSNGFKDDDDDDEDDGIESDPTRDCDDGGGDDDNNDDDNNTDGNRRKNTRFKRQPPKCPPRLKRTQSSINVGNIGAKNFLDNSVPKQSDSIGATQTLDRWSRNIDSYRIAFVAADSKRQRRKLESSKENDQADSETISVKSLDSYFGNIPTQNIATNEDEISIRNNETDQILVTSSKTAIDRNVEQSRQHQDQSKDSRVLCVRSHFQINDGTIYLEDSDWEMCSEISEPFTSLNENNQSLDKRKNSIDLKNDQAKKSIEINFDDKKEEKTDSVIEVKDQLDPNEIIITDIGPNSDDDVIDYGVSVIAKPNFEKKIIRSVHQAVSKTPESIGGQTNESESDRLKKVYSSNRANLSDSKRSDCLPLSSNQNKNEIHQTNSVDSLTKSEGNHLKDLDRSDSSRNKIVNKRSEKEAQIEQTESTEPPKSVEPKIVSGEENVHASKEILEQKFQSKENGEVIVDERKRSRLQENIKNSDETERLKRSILANKTNEKIGQTNSTGNKNNRSDRNQIERFKFRFNRFASRKTSTSNSDIKGVRKIDSLSSVKEKSNVNQNIDGSKINNKINVNENNDDHDKDEEKKENGEEDRQHQLQQQQQQQQSVKKLIEQFNQNNTIKKMFEETNLNDDDEENDDVDVPIDDVKTSETKSATQQQRHQNRSNVEKFLALLNGSTLSNGLLTMRRRKMSPPSSKIEERSERSDPTNNGSIMELGENSNPKNNQNETYEFIEQLIRKIVAEHQMEYSKSLSNSATHSPPSGSISIGSSESFDSSLSSSQSTNNLLLLLMMLQYQQQQQQQHQQQQQERLNEIKLLHSLKLWKSLDLENNNVFDNTDIGDDYNLDDFIAKRMRPKTSKSIQTSAMINDEQQRLKRMEFENILKKVQILFDEWCQNSEQSMRSPMKSIELNRNDSIQTKTIRNDEENREKKTISDPKIGITTKPKSSFFNRKKLKIGKNPMNQSDCFAIKTISNHNDDGNRDQTDSLNDKTLNIETFEVEKKKDFTDSIDNESSSLKPTSIPSTSASSNLNSNLIDVEEREQSKSIESSSRSNSSNITTTKIEVIQSNSHNQLGNESSEILSSTASTTTKATTSSQPPPPQYRTVLQLKSNHCQSKFSLIQMVRNQIEKKRIKNKMEMIRKEQKGKNVDRLRASTLSLATVIEENRCTNGSKSMTIDSKSNHRQQQQPERSEQIVTLANTSKIEIKTPLLSDRTVKVIDTKQINTIQTRGQKLIEKEKNTKTLKRFWLFSVDKDDALKKSSPSSSALAAVAVAEKTSKRFLPQRSKSILNISEPFPIGIESMIDTGNPVRRSNTIGSEKSRLLREAIRNRQNQCIDKSLQISRSTISPLLLSRRAIPKRSVSRLLLKPSMMNSERKYRSLIKLNEPFGDDEQIWYDHQDDSDAYDDDEDDGDNNSIIRSENVNFQEPDLLQRSRTRTKQEPISKSLRSSRMTSLFPPSSSLSLSFSNSTPTSSSSSSLSSSLPSTANVYLRNLNQNNREEIDGRVSYPHSHSNHQRHCFDHRIPQQSFSNSIQLRNQDYRSRSNENKTNSGNNNDINPSSTISLSSLCSSTIVSSDPSVSTSTLVSTASTSTSSSLSQITAPSESSSSTSTSSSMIKSTTGVSRSRLLNDRNQTIRWRELEEQQQRQQQQSKPTQKAFEFRSRSNLIAQSNDQSRHQCFDDDDDDEDDDADDRINNLRKFSRQNVVKFCENTANRKRSPRSSSKPSTSTSSTSSSSMIRSRFLKKSSVPMSPSSERYHRIVVDENVEENEANDDFDDDNVRFDYRNEDDDDDDDDEMDRNQSKRSKKIIDNHHHHHHHNHHLDDLKIFERNRLDSNRKTMEKYFTDDRCAIERSDYRAKNIENNNLEKKTSNSVEKARDNYRDFSQEISFDSILSIIISPLEAQRSIHSDNNNNNNSDTGRGGGGDRYLNRESGHNQYSPPPPSSSSSSQQQQRQHHRSIINLIG
ncbi:hypothetical protein SSS_07364 [Sarcoptes scabiei]|uniref:Uncharacterized protein n=1 Tax=Sarcoptes scabiei TaxID=52283 RepID=A0A834VG80_SARSC|nr:hypothetical protein SSS_07364 [Sarcoptes scabiei]